MANRRNRVLVKCNYCDKEFEVQAFKAKRSRIFCSRTCLIQWLAVIKRQRRIKVRCTQCQVEFEKTPSQLSRGGNFCNMECYTAWRSEHPDEISQRTKAAWANGKLRIENCLAKAHEAVRGKPQSIEHKRKNAVAQSKAYQEGRKRKRKRDISTWAVTTCDTCGNEILQPKRQIKRTNHHFCKMECFAKWCEENHKGEGSAFYGKKHTEETKRKIGIKSKERNAILNALKAICQKPNKQELYLNEILHKYFSNEWEYTGDGKLVINGLVPDFANANGQKAVIELYGDYWHSPKLTKGDWRRTELGRIMAYNSLGYRCLVIWEHELKDEQAVVVKIKQFIKRRS